MLVPGSPALPASAVNDSWRGRGGSVDQQEGVEKEEEEEEDG